MEVTKVEAKEDMAVQAMVAQAMVVQAMEVPARDCREDTTLDQATDMVDGKQPSNHQQAIKDQYALEAFNLPRNFRVLS
jgi:hypothetical protein